MLSLAAAAVAAADAGRGTLDEALDRAPADCRRILEHLLLSVFRYRKSIRRAWSVFCRKFPAPETAALLDAALTQCRYQSAVEGPSVVNVAVRLAKKFHADKFVNAVLRAALRQPAVPPSSAEEILPDAVLRRWRENFSAGEVEKMAGLFLERPEFSFRLCGSAGLPEGCAALEGHPPFRFGSGEPSRILHSPEFLRGEYYIQDPSASLAVALAADGLPGCRKVLDLCAAPGGKALRAAELLGAAGELTAADPSAYRQKLTRENFALRGVTAKIVTAGPEEIDGLFDLVIADVPCSNTGVFRRRPDALWRFSEEALAEIMAIQSGIVRRAAALTAPGGRLLLSSCSIEADENRGLIAAALAAGHFTLLRQAAVLPDRHHDGAFAALLGKNRD